MLHPGNCLSLTQTLPDTVLSYYHRQPLEQVPIIRTHITLLCLLKLRQSQILRRPISVPILRPYRYQVAHTTCGTQANKRDTDRVPRLVIPGRILGQKGIRRDDAADVPKADLPRRTHAASVMPTEVHGEPADDDGHGAETAHGDEEERSIFEAVVVVDGDEDSEASDNNGNRDHGEEETVFRFVGDVCNKHCKGESCSPWRYTVQLRLDRRVAVGSDDAGREVGIAVSRDDLLAFCKLSIISGGGYALTSPKYIKPAMKTL